MDKKGVSGVITAVLLILLVIASIGILWVVIAVFVFESADTIGTGINLVGVDIESVFVDNDGVKVRVKRNSVSGELDAVRIIVEDSSGSKSFDYESTLRGQESESILLVADNHDSVDLLDIQKISVFPVAGERAGSFGDEVDIDEEWKDTYYPFNEWVIGSASIVTLEDGVIALRSPTDAMVHAYGPNWISIDEDKTYRISVWMRGGGKKIPDLNYLSVRQAEADFRFNNLGNTGWGRPYFYGGLATSDWIKYEVIIKGSSDAENPPMWNSGLGLGAEYFQVGVIMNYNSGNGLEEGYTEIKEFRIEEI
jgi:flagellin-like protein